MLIFVKGAYEALIVRGQKTMTIRAWKTCTLRPGDPLSFNGRVRTVITKVEQRTVADLTPVDARADGFPSRAALRRALRQHYPTLAPDARVWCLSFKRVTETPMTRRLLHRTNERTP